MNGLGFRSVLIQVAVVTLAIAPLQVSARQMDLNAMLKTSQEFRARGDLAAAEAEAKRLEQVVVAKFGMDHVNYAIALNNLGMVYRHQGKYAEVDPLFQRALAIRESKLGKDHPEVANSLNNLALVYSDQGKYAEAIPLYQRALAIAETKLGKDHPALNNLADVYRKLRRFCRSDIAVSK